MERKKIQAFLSSFAITVILIGALCGFVIVDLSTDRYMPDRFGPFFEIKNIELEGMDFSFMAKNYRLDAGVVNSAIQKIAAFRGLLPQTPRVLSAFCASAFDRCIVGY